MKRILASVLASAIMFGSTGAAQAVDVTVSGAWDFDFGWVDSSFKKDSGQDHFIAQHRVQTQFNFAVSENLSATLMFELGETKWGRTQDGNTGAFSGYALDADGVNMKTKRAHLDWMIPNSDVALRMGIQEMNLPSATEFYNPVLGCDVAGIVVNAPLTDMIGVTALWARPFDQQDYDGEENVHDEMDMFALMLPVTGDNWTVTPWAAYANIGSASGVFEYMVNYWGVYDDGRVYDLGDSTDSTSAWWAGLSLNMDVFDPLTIAFDVMYGHMNRASVAGSFETADGNTVGVKQRIGMEGWFMDYAIDYKLDWATLGVFGWYTTGDDYDDVKEGMYGRIPAIGYDNGFEATTFGSLGVNSIPTGMAVSCTMLGTWGVGLKVADFSFAEDLSHIVRVSYYRGTNDHEVVENDRHLPLSAEQIYLTDKDGALEINFDHHYKIYENLSAIVELGYIHLWKDDDVWDGQKSWSNTDKSNGWKAHTYLRYAF
jgi:hypothetical protein